MLRLVLSYLLLIASLTSSGQGLLRSTLINQRDTSVVCTLSIQNFENWDNPTYHYFRASTATYLKAGDYVVMYRIDSLWIHAEWIHMSNSWTVLYKYILTERIPLKDIRFLKPSRRDEGAIYLDY